MGKCKSFSWYLGHAAKGMFAPDPHGLKAGSLESTDPANGCVDTLGGTEPGLYPCHWQHGTQAFVLDGNGFLRVPDQGYANCVGDFGQARPKIVNCEASIHGTSTKHLRWAINSKTEQFST